MIDLIEYAQTTLRMNHAPHDAHLVRFSQSKRGKRYTAVWESPTLITTFIGDPVTLAKWLECNRYNEAPS